MNWVLAAILLLSAGQATADESKDSEEAYRKQVEDLVYVSSCTMAVLDNMEVRPESLEICINSRQLCCTYTPSERVVECRSD